MLYKLLDHLNKLDSATYNLIKKGLNFSFSIFIFGIILLLFYTYFIHILNIYYAGLSILESSLFLSVFCIICGISMDTIKKEIN